MNNNGVMNGMNNMNNMNINPMTRNNPAFPTYFNPSPASANAAPTNNIIWVQGIEGAKAYQLNPNSVSILLDSEADGKMYIKISDNIGMCSLRVFNYQEIPATNKSVTVNEDLDLSQYVTRAELNDLVKELKEILANNDTTISTIKPSSVPDSSTAKQSTKPTESVFTKF